MLLIKGPLNSQKRPGLGENPGSWPQKGAGRTGGEGRDRTKLGDGLGLGSLPLPSSSDPGEEGQEATTGLTLPATNSSAGPHWGLAGSAAGTQSVRRGKEATATAGVQGRPPSLQGTGESRAECHGLDATWELDSGTEV